MCSKSMLRVVDDDIENPYKIGQTYLIFLTHMQCNVSLCNGDSGRPAW